MAVTVLSGSDTIVINGRVINDFADQNVGDLSFPNNVAVVKTGKNGNSLYALNTTGLQADLKLRIVRGSADDKFMLALYNSQQNNFAGFVLMQASIVKQLGDGLGNITYDTYACIGGIFVKAQPVISNPEGNTEQNITMYEIMFSNAPRSIG